MMKREKIYIIPTAYGFMYGAGVLVSLIGGAIYNNNLAFMLCFFLLALFMIGMVQTHFNLRYLSIEKLLLFLSPSEGVGHGVIWIKSQNPEGHAQLRVEIRDNDDQFNFLVENIYAKSLYPHYFDFQTGQWGKKQIKRVRLSTRFPFGFFYVWRHFDCPTEYVVYPSPSGEQSLEATNPEGVDPGQNRQLNGDDFSEHKKYVFGDSQKHIDWKAYARGRPLLTKKFEEGQRETRLIDYDLAVGDQERKVRQLSQWVHDCEEDKASYALRIKDRFIPYNTGERHKAACLRLIANLREV